MVSKAKLYSKLDALESQLKEEFLPHLRNAADRNNELVFCVSQFNPFRELKKQTDKKTEEFVEIGSQILSLREKLGESTAGTIAERICWYCREWGGTYKQHKESGLGLAKQFLDEIDKMDK